MADFNKAIKKVLASEGGYSNDPDDIGRETYCGISRRFWPKWEGWKLIDAWKKNKPIKMNTKFKNYHLNDLVEAFYWDHFWRHLKCEQIQNQSVAETLFDHAVNCGKRPAVRLLQSRINLYYTAPNQLFIDGLIGPKTLGSLRTVLGIEKNFPNELIRDRVKDYFSKCEQKKNKYKWLKGWINRSLKSLEK